MRILLLSLILCLGFFVQGQVLTGTIRNVAGEPLPFGTIWVSNLNKGSIANEDGKFAINLPVGSHQIVFRFLGHSPLTKNVEILATTKTLEWQITLVEQAVSLNEVNVGALKEDPAIGIMRRMISMAPFHLKELDSYTAKAYVKGVGKITSISKLMNMMVGKKLEKEAGIKVGSTYVLEGVNQVNYKKPNAIQEKVISNRNNLPSALRSTETPNLRVTQTNFYQPKIFGNLISPLSPNAFQYYRFQYLGSFTQNGQTISKIQVAPKSSFQDLFDGTLSVVEDTWSIYSFSLNFKNANNKVTMQQQNAPFQGVWMPINYDLNMVLDVMGFGAVFRYITQIREYKIQVNKAFLVKPQIIEERLDKKLAKEIDREKIKNPKLDLGGTLTRKKLRKILKEVDKEEVKELKPEFSSDYQFEVDTLASQRSKEFWEEERQVPLTEAEVKGYKEADSLYVIEKGKIKKDSLKNSNRFSIMHLFTPKTYFYEKNRLGNRFVLGAIGGGFSAVDGYFLNRDWEFRHTYGQNNYWNVGGLIRYAFARNRWNAELFSERNFDENRQKLRFSMGSNLYQINSTEPVSPVINQVYALFFSENYLKYYQKDFVSMTYENQVQAKWRLSGTLEYRNRSSLENHVKHGLFYKDREFSSNNPVNLEMPDTRFMNQDQWLFRFGVLWLPSATWRRFNQSRRISNNEGPRIQFQSYFATGTSSYSKLSLLVNHTIPLQRLGRLQVQLHGVHYMLRPTQFIDYTFFKGNEMDVLGSDEFAFRLLPNYLFATSNDHYRMHVKWEPRKLVLTQSTILSLYGLKENIQYSYLQIPNGIQKTAYQEISYGLTGIGKLVGLDVVYPMGDWVPERWKVLVRIPF
jgi:hypothetical protein